MRPITLIYTLRTGQRGTLPCLARSTADALLLAMDTWGLQLRTCSARLSTTTTTTTTTTEAPA